LLFTGSDMGLVITLNLEQFEEVQGYANKTGILVWTYELFSYIAVCRLSMHIL